MTLETINLIKRHFVPKAHRNYSDPEFWAMVENELCDRIVMDAARIEKMSNEDKKELRQELDKSRLLNEKEYMDYCTYYRIKTGEVDVIYSPEMVREWKTNKP
jgi:hypothetical protein